MADIVEASLFEPLIQYFIFIQPDGKFELRCPVGMISVDATAWRKYFTLAEFEVQQGRPWAKLSGTFKSQAVTYYLIDKINHRQ